MGCDYDDGAIALMGDWKLRIHYDTEDSDGNPSYLNKWEHSDGRIAFEGPDSSDPDFERDKLKVERKNAIYLELKKVFLFFINFQWILLFIQGALSIPLNGIWVVCSLVGYSFAVLGGYFVGYLSKRLLWQMGIGCLDIRQLEKLGKIFICISLIALGGLLISVGKFETFSIGYFEISILLVGSSMGIFHGIIDN